MRQGDGKTTWAETEESAPLAWCKLLFLTGSLARGQSSTTPYRPLLHSQKLEHEEIPN